MHFPNTIEWFEEESKNFKEKNCVFYVKIINFSSNWPDRTFCRIDRRFGRSGSAKNGRRFGRTVRFGRTLPLILLDFSLNPFYTFRLFSKSFNTFRLFSFCNFSLLLITSCNYFFIIYAYFYLFVYLYLLNVLLIFTYFCITLSLFISYYN